jgi:hypothetical protein
VKPFFASSSFWWLLTFLVLWLCHFNFFLHGYKSSSSSVVKFPQPSFIRTLIIVFRAFLDNLGKPTHLEILK